ncbi:Chk1 protein kinase [Friedmanniomyces endolithicus]|uniref:Chk1 protein kinase n=1 Tax=Friedmanniomyces endolithicus TaxID=329885 RepID=A0AAN6KIB2_9PEZI|nr:Chk1 protein kinase [Friedmanniomyces endolithicus]KAK0994046.1 Chk1 protein kinase [Friedmanniomyces endolithicus]KAK1044539.1 Chk1 protein kinase [Friedmanniomyces endolithicus]
MGGKGDFGKRKEAGEGASQLCSEERYVGVQSEVSQVAPLPSNLPFRLVSKTIGSGAYASYAPSYPPLPHPPNTPTSSIRKACPPNKPTPIIAVKFIHKPHAFRAGRLRPKQLQLECSLHRSVSGHPNIIRFLSHGEDDAWLWMCLELAEGGDLFDKIEADEGCGVDVAQLYFVQLCEAVAWCHGRGVAHRDIKPENLLVGGSGDLKVADFGLATQFWVPGREVRKRCGMVCGSPPYIAPEILGVGERNMKRKVEGGGGVEEKEGYDPEGADVWSVAVVLFVLLAGNTPWDVPEMGQFEYYDYVMSNGRPKDELWGKIPVEAMSLVRGMLAVEPTKRYTLEDARRHPWYLRANPQMTAEGMVANPVNLATQMTESLHIEFDAPPPSSAASRRVATATQSQDSQRQPAAGDAMDVDSPATSWTKSASTRPDVSPVTDHFDWEAPLSLRAHATQPTHTTNTTATTTHDPRTQTTEAALLAALAEDPSMSQFSQIPVGSMTATQQARRFDDIAPAHSLTRFYSHFSLPHFLPLLSEAFERVGVVVVRQQPQQQQIPTPESQGRGEEEVVRFRIKTADARQQELQGDVMVEQVQLGFDGGLGALEVRFLKAKGDPVGWRRLFKEVAVLCREGIPRPRRTGEEPGGGG